MANENQWGGNFQDFKNYCDEPIEVPVFIIFAEYLGYISKFISDAEKWCEGTIPDIYLQKFLRIEAKSIYRQMLIDYTLDEVRNWYSTYYDIIIKDYDEKLKSLIKQAK